ncbi:WD repeat-containing protein RUP1 [Striga hermonthica]|uniref:WD repeat-containing protein RUP1 n=1 Tax=Striga hermonthica TaxID=68872 RepID=A0A9N7NHM4_STRHE|nr:WD repeat-containing protein RUP1 [Striga hermonthica]
MWDPHCPNSGRCLPTVRPGRDGPSPVCCVEFDPSGGPIMVAVCFDRAVYLYDLRAISSGPTLVLDGHRGPVTYTRFLDFRKVISSSVDGSIIMWSLENEVGPAGLHPGVRSDGGGADGTRSRLGFRERCMLAADGRCMLVAGGSDGVLQAEPVLKNSRPWAK